MSTKPVYGRARHAAFAAAAISFVTLGYACGDEGSVLETNPNSGTGGSTSEGGSAPSAGIGGMLGTGSGGQGGDCLDINLEPELEQRPADIVFIIDNSGSMGDEIDEIQSNLNTSFAAIIAGSGIDYRVIMLTSHGGTNSILQPSSTVCITQPLSSLTTTDVAPVDGVPDACDGAPGNVPSQFYHFDVHLGGSSGNGVQSTDGLCILLETLYGSDGGGYADEWGLHPEGWIKFLREDAVKVFVMVTDDGTFCTPQLPQFPNAPQLRDRVSQGTMIADGKTTATRFDNLLTSLAPNQFGTPEDRNYLWYSIVGIEPKVVPAQGYLPSEPIETNDGDCPGADGATNNSYSPNTGNQWLSVGTKGLRFPVCATGEYDTVFNSIAEGVIKSTAIPCEFDLPAPEDGQEPDLNTLNIVYEPGDVPGAESEFDRVVGEAACGVLDNAFWVDETVVPSRIHLCPYACNRIEDDSLAELGVRFQCGGLD